MTRVSARSANLTEGGGPRTYSVDIESGRLEPLAPAGHRCFRMSPDEKSVLCNMSDAEEDWPPLLYVFEQEEFLEIPGVGYNDKILRWSEDSKYLFIQPWKGEDAARIFRLDLATGKREPWLELGPLDPAGLVRSYDRTNLTPDGGSYCYNVTHLLSDLYLVEGLR